MESGVADQPLLRAADLAGRLMDGLTLDAGQVEAGCLRAGFPGVFRGVENAKTPRPSRVFRHWKFSKAG
jgi:hypothetical protein